MHGEMLQKVASGDAYQHHVLDTFPMQIGGAIKQNRSMEVYRSKGLNSLLGCTDSS
jgi:hypothetical protein